MIKNNKRKIYLIFNMTIIHAFYGIKRSKKYDKK